MKKKIISLFMASAMLLSAASAIAAEKTNPDVYINGAEIEFKDQKAIIQSDRTLVPLRGVFEAMNATVEWREDTRTVAIDSEDNIKHILLTIDNPEMEVYTFTSILNADKEVVTLDVAPQIQNDRTLIPLRAISEAINAKVDWSQEDYRVDIATQKQPKDTDPVYYLSTEATTAAAGETFDIYLNVKNLSAYENAAVTSISAGVAFDKENYELVGAVMLSANGETLPNSLSESNPEYSKGLLRASCSTAMSDEVVRTDGAILKLTFKALTGEKGEFALKNNFVSVRGYANLLGIYDGTYRYELDAVSGLNLDTTTIVINAE